jgi:hypothetical protein
MLKNGGLAALMCVLVHCALVAWIAAWDTPSPDEMGHLAGGSHGRVARVMCELGVPSPLFALVLP